MWSEKRGIEDFIFFAVFPILINITTSYKSLINMNYKRKIKHKLYIKIK